MGKNQLKEWGIPKVEEHSFDRSHRGWELHSFDIEMTHPSYAKIKAYPAAFVKGTPEKVEGEVLYLNHWRELFDLKDSLTNKIVLLGDTYRPASNQTQPFTSRFTQEQLNKASENQDPNHRVIGYLGRRSINNAITNSYNRRNQMQPFFEFADQEGVLALVEASNFPYGIIHADGNNHFPSYIHVGDIQPLPCFIFANEDFGRMKRLLDLGITPRLTLHLDASFSYDPLYNKNLLAILPGSDESLKNQSVIIGSHFDSWHAGTGAVDNGSGVVVMMEALRLLKALDLPLKRSVKLALWGGEEQIFAGSFGYVEDFVGDIQDGQLKPAALDISVYLNLDNGAGKIRGVYTMGNQAVRPLFENWLEPFPQSNFITQQYTDQTDHELFDRLNIPAFQFIQDPLDYMTAIHHTNMDVYEYVNQEDLKYNAVLLAYLIYQIANSTNQLPRKPFNSPKPSSQGATRFYLKGNPNAQQVNLIGDFNNWNLFGTLCIRLIVVGKLSWIYRQENICISFLWMASLSLTQ